MTPDTTLGFEQVAIELVRGIADAVADRPGLTEAQRSVSQQTTVYSVMGLQPRDPVEIMLAGHCVIYDHMLRDGARDLLRGQDEQIKLRARPGTLASGKMFLSSLDMLLRMQNRGAGKISTLPTATQSSTPREPVPQPPTEVAHPPPPPAAPAKPRFVCERVHPPRHPQGANAPRYGAAFRLRETARPDAPRMDERPGPASFRAHLRGTVSHIALPVPEGCSIGAPAESFCSPIGAPVAARDPVPEQYGIAPVSSRPQTAARPDRITPAIQPASIGET